MKLLANIEIHSEIVIKLDRKQFVMNKTLEHYLVL